MKNPATRRMPGGLSFVFPAGWRWLGLSLAMHCANLLASCSQPTPEKAAPPTATPQEQVAGASQQTTIKYAKGFTIQYVGNYKIVKILNPFKDHTDTACYVLVPRGQSRPAGYGSSSVIETPIRTLVGTSSMHIALADFLNADDVLVGLGSLQYASAPAVRKRIAEGKIKAFGENSLNEEQLIAQHPDLVMTMGSPGAPVERFHTLAAAGVPVMVNSEWVETTPLARAEWVKLLATLLNKEAVVNQKFAKVEAEYQRLTALTRRVTKRPQVLTGLPFKDTWYMPDGESYTAQFFRDAGGAYHWDQERAAGSLALAFEAVYPVALTADCWVNTGTANTKAEILAQDARYADFQPFKTGAVYNNNKRTDGHGSNDYWESGAVHPEVILADLIKILHPELLPQHELVYYKQLK
ncbi:ABC transporter substrate-binding protein [Hymenobacter sp. GOD-10R]|uniref:ABC transporter substrate-binding protein n=1 Tax=Hymenobacter sp. GOD-10R TaxID=3093922 RepID=UPI002D778CC0|nr:ABC transporter substrate-binding protein [Hymenobacter sp. GOD-10R]WRQ29017.1 ABC transporter substrate-binding protein [Hymenobacter sp. GOD-10R]